MRIKKISNLLDFYSNKILNFKIYYSLLEEENCKNLYDNLWLLKISSELLL